jgi:hypothetical protein
MPEPADMILIARSVDAWIVQVGSQRLCQFDNLIDARAFAETVAQDAGGAGSHLRVCDLSMYAASSLELLEDGQEEVFAASEVALGQVEHNVSAGAH